jgi:hypothetical protein
LVAAWIWLTPDVDADDVVAELDGAGSITASNTTTLMSHALLIDGLLDDGCDWADLRVMAETMWTRWVGMSVRVLASRRPSTIPFDGGRMRSWVC